MTPYQPAGWSDKIVVSTTSGQRSDTAVIYDDQDIFVSWAVINESLTVDILPTFYSQLVVDGTAQMTWSTVSLQATFYTYVADYQLGRLPAGVHSIRLTVDSIQAIAEANENDNAYAKTITVRSRGTRNISLSGNLVFGNVAVGSFVQRTLTISNNGTLPLTVNSLTYPSGFSGNWSGGTIPAGASRDVVVTFRPLLKISYGGTIVVNSDSSSGIGSITIAGTGVTTNPVVAKNDFNGDGLPDIVFQNADGSVGTWFMNGNENLFSASLFKPGKLGDLGWQIVGSGDFNADGKTDLLFQHNDGSLAAWLMDGTTLVSATALKPQHPGAGWLVVGTGDFNQDGKVDILFQHQDGTLTVWFMNGVNLTQGQLLKSKFVAGWSAVGTGDFNQDGKTDILVEYLDGTLGVWFMDGINFQRGAILNPPHPASEGWRVSAILDLNKDSKPDLVLQHEDGTLAVWFMNGTNLSAGRLINPSNPGSGWQVVGPK